MKSQKKKQLFKLFSLILSAVIGVLMFAACVSRHKYADKYTYDETHHWYACTDSGCKKVKARAKHNFGEWVIDKKASMTEQGSKHRDCKVCEYKQTEVVPVLEKSANSVTLKKDVSLDKEHDGNPVSIVATQFNYKGDGEITFKYATRGSSEWVADAPSAVGKYTVKVTVAESEMYKSADAMFDFEIFEKKENPVTLKQGVSLGKAYDGNAVTVKAEQFDYKGDGAVSFKYQKDGEEEWKDEAPSAIGKYSVKVTVAESRMYLAGEAMFPFEITKAESKVSLKSEAQLGKVYDGMAVDITKDKFDITGDGAVTLMFGVKEADDWKEEAPADAKGYTVKVTVAESETHKECVEMFDFEITKAQNEVTLKSAGSLDKVYDGSAVMFTSDLFDYKGDGAVTFSYKKQGAEDLLTEAPSEVGTYVLKVMVAESANYQSGEAMFQFEISDDVE